MIVLFFGVRAIGLRFAIGFVAGAAALVAVSGRSRRLRQLLLGRIASGTLENGASTLEGEQTQAGPQSPMGWSQWALAIGLPAVLAIALFIATRAHQEKVELALNAFADLQRQGIVSFGAGGERAGTAPAAARADEYFRMGVLYCKRHDLAEGIAELSEAVRLNPSNAAAYFWRGCAYFGKGDAGRAALDFTEVIRWDPTTTDAYFNRGGAYRVGGEFDRAIADFDECLRRDPGNADAYKSRGGAHKSKGELDKAIKDFSEGLRLAPADPAALSARGWAYSRAGEFEKAAADYAAAGRLAPTDGVPYNGLAWLRATCPRPALRDARQAIELATKACELSNWTNGLWTDTLAAAYAEAGEFEKAEAWEQESIRLNPIMEGLCAEMEQRLSLYQAHIPYREWPPTAPR